MKLVELVAYFRKGGSFREFCREQGIRDESEVVEIYAEEPVNINSVLNFFPIEETGGCVSFEFNGRKYENLFDFFYFLDVMEGAKSQIELSDLELADKIFAYAVKDA
ncbi:hypothetical protein DBR00_17075 [Pseudomonas sp. HMWF032]|uniref:hypothetical protein n=1 Tax=Pseudomonas sp. HMWF032 TaxID=2056866 RepID=UPI000D381907|nr:hypothetical protein [Pseudomonas sp. HMWF032]PTS82818.1 hypothetical protein DBR00_17075 [Pseudomonas sp. HMWF032]PTT85960.1 hypothetical protein DBR41_02120 [Pseudomonas sp. HMWF010]